MADYKLRLLTSLTDTDYIKINENDGMPFGIFKSNVLPGVLQTTAPLSSSLQIVKDNVGTNSPLQLSTAQVAFGAFTGATTGDIIWRANSTLTEYTGWHQSDGDYKLITKNGSPIFINIAYGLNFANGFGTQGGFNGNGFYVGTGTITQNGAVTIKGSGSNILSLRNSSNVEVSGALSTGILFSDGISIGQTNVNLKGIVQSGSQIQVNYVNSGGVRFSNSSSGFKTLIVGEYSEDMISMGGITASFPAIKRNGAAIDFRLANDSGYCSIRGFYAVFDLIYNSTFNIGFAGGTVGIHLNNVGSTIFSATGATSINASAQVQVDSTTKGFLMPRMTTTQINAISTPANGLQVYNTDLNQPCFYDETGWRKVTHSNM